MQSPNYHQAKKNSTKKRNEFVLKKPIETRNAVYFKPSMKYSHNYEQKLSLPSIFVVNRHTAMHHIDNPKNLSNRKWKRKNKKLFILLLLLSSLSSLFSSFASNFDKFIWYFILVAVLWLNRTTQSIRLAWLIFFFLSTWLVFFLHFYVRSVMCASRIIIYCVWIEWNRSKRARKQSGK